MPWVFHDFGFSRLIIRAISGMSTATCFGCNSTAVAHDRRLLSSSKSVLSAMHGRDQNFAIARICTSHGVIAYFDCHVTSVLESDWRALYSARSPIRI